MKNSCRIPGQMMRRSVLPCAQQALNTSKKCTRLCFRLCISPVTVPYACGWLAARTAGSAVKAIAAQGAQAAGSLLPEVELVKPGDEVCLELCEADVEKAAREAGISFHVDKRTVFEVYHQGTIQQAEEACAVSIQRAWKRYKQQKDYEKNAAASVLRHQGKTLQEYLVQRVRAAEVRASAQEQLLTARDSTGAAGPAAATQKRFMEEIEAEVVKLRLDNLGLQTQADRVWTIQEELEAEKAANTVTAKEMAAQKMVLVEVQAQVLHLRIDNMNLHGRAQQASSLQEELEAEKAAKAEAAQEVETIRETVSSLEEELKGEKRAKANTDQELAANSERLSGLEEELEDERMAKADIAQELAEVSERTSHLEEELEDDRRAKADVAQSYEDEIEELSGQMTVERRTAANQQAQLDDLHHRLSVITAQATTLRADLAIAAEAQTEAQQEKDVTSRLVSSLEEQLEAEKAAKAEAAQVVETIRERVADLEEELEGERRAKANTAQAHRTDQACLQRQPLGLSKKSADLASNLEGSQAEVQRIHKELSHSPPRLTSMKSQTAQLRQQLAQAKSLHSHVVKDPVGAEDQLLVRKAQLAAKIKSLEELLAASEAVSQTKPRGRRSPSPPTPCTPAHRPRPFDQASASSESDSSPDPEPGSTAAAAALSLPALQGRVPPSRHSHPAVIVLQRQINDLTQSNSQLDAVVKALRQEVDSVAQSKDALHRQWKVPLLEMGHWDQQHDEELGRGGNGSVFRLDSLELGDTAVKVGFQRELAVEAEMMATVRHAYILPVLGLLTDCDQPSNPDETGYMVMKCAGSTLRDTLRRDSRSTQEVVVRSQQLAAAVAWLHTKGVVHQDLHSSNVLKSLDGPEFLIADFGNANWILRPGTTKRTELHCSKCGMGMEAPEMADQLFNLHYYNPDPAQDVYAFGLLLLELAGGERPTEHAQVLAQAGKAGPDRGPAITQQYARSLLSRPPHQPPYKDLVYVPREHESASSKDVSLAGIIKGCLEADPTKRSTAHQVSSLLYFLRIQNDWFASGGI